MVISGDGGALPTCVPPLRRASPPEGERMSFCDQMAAAIDGARTLTRLDHLSRSIWQGLAAGAVADDDAQALAERLHARRGAPARRSQAGGHSTRPPLDLPAQAAAKGSASARSRLPAAATWPRPVRCRLRWPASSRSASWRCCGSSGTRSASTGTVLGASMRSRRGPGSAAGWFRTPSERRPGLGLLTIEERRREGRRNLPNVVRIVSKEWTTLAGEGRAVEPSAGRAADRVQKNAPHG